MPTIKILVMNLIGVRCGEMIVNGTRIYEENLEALLGGKRRALNEGGTSSSKTYSIMQILILVCQSSKFPIIVSVVSESLPHLKRGCIRDFIKIMGDLFDEKRWNKTDSIYTWPQAQLEFIGADMPAKQRGARRFILFINECNNVSYTIFQEMDIRTERFTFLDWNPVGEFWVHENKLRDNPENAYIHSTYLDAHVLDESVLPQEVITNIESNKDRDPNWWHIYGLGLLGKIEGLVYLSFKQVDRLPEGNVFYGLDYGYSSDPTVLVKNVIKGDDLYSHQMFFETSPMTNDEISRKMDLMGVSYLDPIYPDPSEPKSAEEIRLKGFNVQQSESGKGSVEYGIRKVNSYYQHWTEDSLECIKEQRNFKFIKRKESGSGREYLSDDTTHQWSHGMSARRYAVASQIGVIGGSNKIPVLAPRG